MSAVYTLSTIRARQFLHTFLSPTPPTPPTPVVPDAQATSFVFRDDRALSSTLPIAKGKEDTMNPRPTKCC